MPITLLRSKLPRSWIALTISLSFAQFAIADDGCFWRVRVGRQPTLELDGKKIKLARALIDRMRTADEGTFLPIESAADSARHTRWMVLRASSRTRGDAGFCGSGHEDLLVLVEVSGSTARHAGEFLAQSCLQSISMDADQFGDLLSSLGQDPKDGSLTFQQTLSNESEARRQSVKIQVIGGRMRAVTQPLQE